ncbi:unnamed protein product [Diabrotica balteata]|uniref:Peptidase S1 domain-containing protein n=1 Tax=Diabrotica balteata TaxID=107213 RepID=A0A9N9T1L4_DIABA|nr:unnamed protein product [Diabrotica balteata]
MATIYELFDNERNNNTEFFQNYTDGLEIMKSEVAGWGLTEKGNASEILKVISIPYKDGATCAKELPQTWEEQYYFIDKICAGRQNESIAVCKGDSGSGLVFENREDHRLLCNTNEKLLRGFIEITGFSLFYRYYLQGLVSIAPKLNMFECNYQTNALYTNVPFYYNFIIREMTKNHLEDCILPAYPKNGKWFIKGGIEKKPGDVVSSLTILRFSCNMQYKLSTLKSYYTCQSYYNHPTCLNSLVFLGDLSKVKPIGYKRFAKSVQFESTPISVKNELESDDELEKQMCLVDNNQDGNSSQENEEMVNQEIDESINLDGSHEDILNHLDSSMDVNQTFDLITESKNQGYQKRLKPIIENFVRLSSQILSQRINKRMQLTKKIQKYSKKEDEAKIVLSHISAKKQSLQDALENLNSGINSLNKITSVVHNFKL